jgi:hypothetical protein
MKRGVVTAFLIFLVFVLSSCVESELPGEPGLRAPLGQASEYSTGDVSQYNPANNNFVVIPDPVTYEGKEAWFKLKADADYTYKFGYIATGCSGIKGCSKPYIAGECCDGWSVFEFDEQTSVKRDGTVTPWIKGEATSDLKLPISQPGLEAGENYAISYPCKREMDGKFDCDKHRKWTLRTFAAVAEETKCPAVTCDPSACASGKCAYDSNGCLTGKCESVKCPAVTCDPKSCASGKCAYDSNGCLTGKCESVVCPKINCVPENCSSGKCAVDEKGCVVGCEEESGKICSSYPAELCNIGESCAENKHCKSDNCQGGLCKFPIPPEFCDNECKVGEKKCSGNSLEECQDTSADCNEYVKVKECKTCDSNVKDCVDEVVIDSDSDGVPDDKDKCPGTKVGVSVDADGCPTGCTPNWDCPVATDKDYLVGWSSCNPDTCKKTKPCVDLNNCGTECKPDDTTCNVYRGCMYPGKC